MREEKLREDRESELIGACEDGMLSDARAICFRKWRDRTLCSCRRTFAAADGREPRNGQRVQLDSVRGKMCTPRALSLTRTALQASLRAPTERLLTRGVLCFVADRLRHLHVRRQRSNLVAKSR